jgi:hypothetical protein
MLFTGSLIRECCIGKSSTIAGCITEKLDCSFCFSGWQKPNPTTLWKKDGSWLMAHGSWLACPESSMPAIMLETILGKEISPMKTKKEKHETGVE